MDSSSLQPPGDFPDEWRRLAFDDFTTLKRGKDLTRDQFRNGRIPVAGSNGPIGFHDTANVKAPGATVGRSGSVGRVTFYGEDFWAHNTALFVANFHGNDERFAAYFLESVKLNRFGSGVSVPTLDRNVFRGLPVVVPPLPEQRKIAGVLGLVQRAMEQQERLIEKTAELKKTLLHQLFTQGLRGEPQKQTDLGPIPKSWEVVRISDLFKFSSGKKRPDDTSVEWSHSKSIPIYGGNGILGYSSEFLLESPVLVLGRVGEYCGCAHHTDGKAWISDNALYSKKTSPKILTRWAAEYLTFANLNQYSGRAGQPLITQGVIGEVKMPLPSIDEQGQMESAFSILNQKLAHHRRKHATLSALFRTLLHQLMTAQLRVHDLDLDRLLARAE